MPRPSISGATAAATTNAFSRRVSLVGRPLGETDASSHPAKKCVTGLIGLKKSLFSTYGAIKKFQIGGDADWLAIGFRSVWVTVAKNNEVVRVDPVRNVVQARVKVDKEPCYGIGIGVDRVWVLNCQGKTLTRINPKTNAVDMRVPVKIDDSGEGSIAVDERYVWYASNEDGHSGTLSQVEVKTGRKLKGIT